MFVYLGACVAGDSRGHLQLGGKKPSTKAASKNQPPQPMVQDNTDNNVADLKNQLAAERQKSSRPRCRSGARRSRTCERDAAQQAAAAGYGPTGQPVACVPGQPCGPNGYPQQPGGSSAALAGAAGGQQLAAKDRERAYNARFSSNLVYSRPPDPPPSTNCPEPALSAANPYALRCRRQQHDCASRRGRATARATGAGAQA